MFRIREYFADLRDRFGRLAATLLWPFDWLMHSIGELLVLGSEGGERFDWGLAAIGRVVTWPFRAVGNLFRWLFPESLRDALATPWYVLAWLLHTFLTRLVWLAEKLNLDVVFYWLAWLTKPIWYPLAAVGNFFVMWAATRPYRQLVWGLPAMVLLLPILAAAVWGAWWGQGTVAARYRIALRQAMEEKDYDRSALYERKLAQLGVDTQRSDFNTADALARDGKLDEAYERMQRLAPEDEPGYPPAHHWITFQLLSGKLDVPPEEAHRLEDVHLKHLVTLGVRGEALDYMRAFWTAQDGDPERAAELLEPLVQSIPMAAVQRMQIDLALGREQEARSDALVVRQHMQSRSRDGDTLAPDEYRAWVVAEEVLGNTAGVRTVLTELVKHDPDNETAKYDLARIELREFNTLLRELYPDPDELAERLVAAFTLREATPEMKQQLLAVYQQHASRPTLSKTFDRLAERPDLPAGLAETLGTSALISGHWDQAHVFLQKALELSPDNAVAWNNLACVLYQRPDPDYDEALRAVNRALELMPNEYHFRDTRGQIFVKLSRWNEAVADLEYAINGMPNMPAIHESLAVAYEALGETQLASIHRREAE